MMNADNRIYAVVVFPPDKGSTEETVSVIPQSWLKKGGCIWPKVKNPNKLIEDCLHPSRSTCEWIKCSVKEICRENIDGLKKARTIETNVMERKEENLSELSDLPPKRPVQAKAAYSPSARLDNADDADNESDDSLVTTHHRIGTISSPSSSDGSPNETLKLPTPPFKKQSPIKRSKSVPKNLFGKLRKTFNGSTVGKAPSSTSFTDNDDLVRTNSEDTREHTRRNSEGAPEMGHINRTARHSDSGGHTEGGSKNSTASHNNNNETPPSTSNNNNKTLPSTSVQAPTLNFGLVLPASKASSKFLSEWEKMTPSEKEAYTAESLFILRRNMAVMMHKVGSSPSGTSTVDAFRKDASFNCFPIDGDTKLNEATDNLKKKGFKGKLTKLLLSKKCDEINETGRRMCSSLFTDEFGRGYSMKGRKHKKKFLDLPLVTLIKTALGIAYQSKIPILTDEEKNSALNAWVKYCGTRIKQKAAAANRDENQSALLPVSEDEEEEVQDNE